MDFFDSNTVKPKKAALLWFRYSHHFRSIPLLLQFLELCLPLYCLFKISNRLPFLFSISVKFFRQVIANQVFVFIICNALIVILIVKSNIFSSENPAADNAEAEFYEELLKENENHLCFTPLSLSETPPDSPGHATAEIEFQDKEIILSNSNNINIPVTKGGEDDDEIFSASGLDSEPDSGDSKAYRRSKSERVKQVKPKKTLRRSETEKCMNGELSDQEFQSAVEEFIAKHLKFRRQESLSTVL